jgi:hypothetical protein
MPPAKRTTDTATTANTKPDPYELSVGKVVNISISGKTVHRSAEILTVSGSGLTVRTNSAVPPGAEITFVPWSAIEGVGICGAR